MEKSNIYILGISAFYHDSAAALIKDGEIVAAAQEERFTRKKHDPSFPTRSIEYCLREASISVGDIDIIAFYDKPFIKFERLLETYVSYAPFGIRSFISSMPPWIKKKLFMKEFIAKELGYKGKFVFPEHHHSHASSAFYPSPFKEAAILTVDGVGEWATASFGVGKDSKIELFEEIRFPHSLGLLYSAFTYYCGFKVNSGEYKLMGLAPYGEPKYADLILEKIIDLKEDGSFKLNLEYFNYCTGLTMTSRKFHDLFGGPPRKPESKLQQKHMDLASSVQAVTEKAIMNMARHVHEKTGSKNICLAGGVALNCVANGKVLREGPFESMWIQPASSDAGGALGAALVAWHEYLDKPRETFTEGEDMQKASLLGPSFSDEEIEKYLVCNDIPHEKLKESEIAKRVAKIIADQNVVGWFQGRMEFGPRALGARSILGDPRSEHMQSIINRKIKFRESFRPFAPSVLLEKSEEYFDLEGESPYMLLVAPVREKRREKGNEEKAKGLERVKEKRSDIPAITHVDYSARVQTVKEKDNPAYYDLIRAFCEDHDCPVVINTSFNVRGEPIVCSPDDAYKCFMRTNMDYLVLGPFLVDKKKQDPSRLNLSEVDEFDLD